MADKDTILVVDDEEVLRQGCSRVLKSEGFRVITAANGREALEQLAAEPVNVVLCDLKMPVMGALEVLEEAGVRYPEIPVIIMTGLGTVADAVECMKKGAYDFITKPFGIEHLILVVRRALEKQKLQEQTRRLAGGAGPEPLQSGPGAEPDAHHRQLYGRRGAGDQPGGGGGPVQPHPQAAPGPVGAAAPARAPVGLPRRPRPPTGHRDPAGRGSR